MFSCDRLRERRISMGLTQEEVGKIAGITRSAVQKYERGIIKNVYTSTLELFAQALRCSPAYLMCWTDNPREGMELELNSKEREIIRAYRELNDEGAEKVEEYIKDISSSGRYIKSDSAGMVSEA